MSDIHETKKQWGCMATNRGQLRRNLKRQKAKRGRRAGVSIARRELSEKDDA